MSEFQADVNLKPFADFREAATGLLEALFRLIPLRTWMVATESEIGWIAMVVVDRTHALEDGGLRALPRDDVVMPGDIVHFGPLGNHDARTQDLESSEVAMHIPVVHHLNPRAYIGVPIQRHDGTVLATLCGVDQEPCQIPLDDCFPTVVVTARLLASLLAEHRRVHAEERQREMLERAANTDALTGLANRRAWDEALLREQMRVKVAGYPTTLVSIDVDGLKRVNDEQGHTAGDSMLTEVAAAIRTAIRPQDVVARLGGDEFGILCADCSRTGARFVIERLRYHLERHNFAASVGAATSVDAADLAKTWKMADDAMYQEKRRRKRAISG